MNWCTCNSKGILGTKLNENNLLICVYGCMLQSISCLVFTIAMKCDNEQMVEAWRYVSLVTTGTDFGVVFDLRYL